jgi:hypothetical protein
MLRLRSERFNVYRNNDGPFHVAVVNGNGGDVFADRFASEDAAQGSDAAVQAAWDRASLACVARRRGGALARPAGLPHRVARCA